MAGWSVIQRRQKATAIARTAIAKDAMSKGAHSTATRKMIGKLAAAEGGTLLLDEIGELPQESQAKLLAFLQSAYEAAAK